MSGTIRVDPVIPLPSCHAGRGKYLLLPPPPAAQPFSRTVLSLASFSVVPPTATTHGSDDSYSACRGPPECWPLESGFDPASPVETKTLMPAAASRRNLACSVFTSP